MVSMMKDIHANYMQLALEQARFAGQANEVPVGAVVELNGEIIGSGFNLNRSSNDPSAHAEIIALRAAAQSIGNYRLNGASLYVTLEPCVMCAGAILHARIKRLIYATPDERWGAAGSIANVLQSPLLNHRCEITSGVLQPQAARLLSEFFSARRE
jgi:tRNA(adenine34) deaminase